MIHNPVSNCCDADAVSVNHEDSTGSCTECKDHCEVHDTAVLFSEVNLLSSSTIETKTDIVRYVETEASREGYIAEFGDVAVVWDAEYRTWRVPAFKAEIDKYCEYKAEQCRRWGCN